MPLYYLKHSLNLMCIYITVPSMGPVNVIANATSSTTIVVSWGDVPSDQRNGIIEGFKVN